MSWKGGLPEQYMFVYTDEVLLMKFYFPFLTDYFVRYWESTLIILRKYINFSLLKVL